MAGGTELLEVPQRDPRLGPCHLGGERGGGPRELEAGTRCLEGEVQRRESLQRRVEAGDSGGVVLGERYTTGRQGGIRSGAAVAPAFRNCGQRRERVLRTAEVAACQLDLYEQFE